MVAVFQVSPRVWHCYSSQGANCQRMEAAADIIFTDLVRCRCVMDHNLMDDPHLLLACLPAGSRWLCGLQPSRGLYCCCVRLWENVYAYVHMCINLKHRRAHMQRSSPHKTLFHTPDKRRFVETSCYSKYFTLLYLRDKNIRHSVTLTGFLLKIETFKAANTSQR